eukprot:IDg23854t1
MRILETTCEHGNIVRARGVTAVILRALTEERRMEFRARRQEGTQAGKQGGRCAQHIPVAVVQYCSVLLSAVHDTALALLAACNDKWDFVLSPAH